MQDLGKFKATVDDFNSDREKETRGTTSYEIIFTDTNGEKTLRHFDKTEYSERGKLLLNEVSTALEEMGQAISEQEKRQVLVEILENLCQ